MERFIGFINGLSFTLWLDKLPVKYQSNQLVFEKCSYPAMAHTCVGFALNYNHVAVTGPKRVGPDIKRSRVHRLESSRTY